MNIKTGMAVAVAGLLFFASQVNATIIFENPFPPSSSTGYFSAGQNRTYDSFTLSSDSTINGFEFGAYSSSYMPTSFNVSIFSDSTFSTSLFSQDYLISEATQTSMGAAINLLVSLPNINLGAGDYWISPYALSGSTLALNVSIPSIDGSAFQNSLAVNVDVAMRIYGTTVSVPEPSTLAIFALGLMGLASRRFMKKS